MEFVYENQGHITYLSYAISQEDVVDTMTLGMITNNKIPGLAPSIFTQMDTTKYIKYNVSAKISVQQFFSGAVAKKHLLGVFKGIISAVLAAEDYMIDINSIIFDLNYIFADVSTCEVALVCLPVQQDATSAMNLNAFFKNIMFSTQFDQSENCDYVAKIINYLNASPVFSLEDFKTLLDSLSSVSAQPTVPNTVETKKETVTPAANVQPTQTVQQVSAQPVSNAQQPVVNSAVQTPVAATPNVTVPPVSSKPVTPAVPQKAPEKFTEAPAKKKGGLFGLFSSNDKKPKEEKKTPATPSKVVTPPPASGNAFAIPGQKVPVQNNSNGFAIPGQKVPVNSQPAIKEQPAQKVEKVAPAVAAASTTPAQVVNTPPVIQSQPMNFGETTVLGGGNMGETTVLGVSSAATVQENPHLIRAKNNEKINLNKPVFRIGKEKSYVDYFIGDNTAISRSHANFISRDGEYFVTDTNSTNHTYVNGVMIQSNVETKLVHGDKVRLANEDFEFKLY